MKSHRPIAHLFIYANSVKCHFIVDMPYIYGYISDGATHDGKVIGRILSNKRVYSLILHIILIGMYAQRFRILINKEFM